MRHCEVLQASTSGQTERRNRSDAYLSPRIMAREATKILAAKGIEVGPATLRRLVTRFIRDGITTLAELESRVISYADPTGDHAVRNVLRDRGW